MYLGRLIGKRFLCLVLKPDWGRVPVGTAQRGLSCPRVLAVSHMEDQPHRQVGGRVAGAGLPLQDGVLRCPEGKRTLAEVLSFGKRLTT